VTLNRFWKTYGDALCSILLLFAKACSLWSDITTPELLTFIQLRAKLRKDTLCASLFYARRKTKKEAFAEQNNDPARPLLINMSFFPDHFTTNLYE